MPKVVVVTGASSGMGRETARRLAARGDKVVACARRAELLDSLARECEAVGGEALAVPADVTDEHAVGEAFEHAVARFGRVDACVNAAAVAAFGKIWEVPVATMRRLVEVDLVGSMVVARAAVRQFLRQGEGTLVLVSSALGKTPLPYLGVYNAAKHGVVGLAASLRADLKEEGVADRVKVCNLMPPSTDTPFYVHAANYTGRVPHPPPPSYDVDALAQAIVDAVDDPQEEVMVGTMTKLMVASHGVLQGAYEKLAGPYSDLMFLDRPAPRTEGSVFEPIPQGRTAEGGWKEGTLMEKRRGLE